MLSANNWWHGVSKKKSLLQKEEAPLRIGVLSAAAINYTALFDPVESHPGAVVAAVAARDVSRAQAQIKKYKLPACKAYGNYNELLADPNIDAIYIPLPNGLHAEWAIKSMEAGKHVLIEKAITSNAAQAREVQDAAARMKKVALEAYHWRFHPAAHVTKAIVDSGKYGNPISVKAGFGIPRGAINKDDIRYNYKLGGGK
jgi:predicted dehydrogenase